MGRIWTATAMEWRAGRNRSDLDDFEVMLVEGVERVKVVEKGNARNALECIISSKMIRTGLFIYRNSYGVCHVLFF